MDRESMEREMKRTETESFEASYCKGALPAKFWYRYDPELDYPGGKIRGWMLECEFTVGSEREHITKHLAVLFHKDPKKFKAWLMHTMNHLHLYLLLVAKKKERFYYSYETLVWFEKQFKRIYKMWYAKQQRGA